MSMVERVAQNIYAEAISLGMVRNLHGAAVGSWPNEEIRAAYRHIAMAAMVTFANAIMDAALKEEPKT